MTSLLHIYKYRLADVVSEDAAPGTFLGLRVHLDVDSGEKKKKKKEETALLYGNNNETPTKTPERPFVEGARRGAAG